MPVSAVVPKIGMTANVSSPHAQRLPGHAADAYFDPGEMAKARVGLRYETGGMPTSMLMIDRLEWRPGRGADGYAWEIKAWTGGDIDRLEIRSKGEGRFGGSAERIELQVGWSHAIDPWFNLRAGVQQDFQAHARRTHAVLAIEGLAPYWFDVDGELFLSQKGEATTRVEVSYDQRITQKLIVQPALEINASAQKVSAIELGSGFTSIELGARLRYEISPEFSPYIGLHWERELGQTARFLRTKNEDPGSARLALGVRAWF
jgi:copper resistance protein B